jgi:hypothetical protein
MNCAPERVPQFGKTHIKTTRIDVISSLADALDCATSHGQRAKLKLTKNRLLYNK